MGLWTEQTLEQCGVHIADPEDRQKLLEILEEETARRIRRRPDVEPLPIHLSLMAELEANRDRVNRVFLPEELNTPLEHLGLTRYMVHLLKNAGVETLGDLLCRDREEIYSLFRNSYFRLKRLQGELYTWLKDKIA